MVPRKRRILGVFAMLLLASGCGEKDAPPDKVYSPEKLAGAVDPKLPPEAQARQEALRSVLMMTQRGTELQFAPAFCPGVAVAETMEHFLDGAAHLDRWDFDGPPKGEDLAVTMHFSTLKPGEQRRAQRVYTVSGTSGHFEIRRKPAGP